MPTTATDEDFDSLIPSAEDPETSYFDLTSFQDGSTEADDHNLEDALRTINAFHSAFEQSDTLNYFADSDSDLEDAEYHQQVNFHHPACQAPDDPNSLGYLTDDDCPDSQQAYLQNINIFGKVGEMFKKAKDAVLPAGQVPKMAKTGAASKKGGKKTAKGGKTVKGEKTTGKEAKTTGKEVEYGTTGEDRAKFAEQLAKVQETARKTGKKDPKIELSVKIGKPKIGRVRGPPGKQPVVKYKINVQKGAFKKVDKKEKIAATKEKDVVTTQQAEVIPPKGSPVPKSSQKTFASIELTEKEMRNKAKFEKKAAEEYDIKDPKLPLWQDPKSTRQMMSDFAKFQKEQDKKEGFKRKSKFRNPNKTKNRPYFVHRNKARQKIHDHRRNLKKKKINDINRAKHQEMMKSRPNHVPKPKPPKKKVAQPTGKKTQQRAENKALMEWQKKPLYQPPKGSKPLGWKPPKKRKFVFKSIWEAPQPNHTGPPITAPKDYDFKKALMDLADENLEKELFGDDDKPKKGQKETQPSEPGDPSGQNKALPGIEITETKPSSKEETKQSSKKEVKSDDIKKSNSTAK